VEIKELSEQGFIELKDLQEAGSHI